MKPHSIYRERAEQCLILAEMMTHPDARAAMLDAAHKWKVLADLAERYSTPPATDADDKSSR